MNYIYIYTLYLVGGWVYESFHCRFFANPDGSIGKKMHLVFPEGMTVLDGASSGPAASN